MTATTITAPRIDAVFDLDALLSDEEREWRDRARRFAQERILPVIEQDFEDKHFRTRARARGRRARASSACTSRATAAPARAPSSYGLVCLELEAADSGWRTSCRCRARSR